MKLLSILLFLPLFSFSQTKTETVFKTGQLEISHTTGAKEYYMLCFRNAEYRQIIDMKCAHIEISNLSQKLGEAIKLEKGYNQTFEVNSSLKVSRVQNNTWVQFEIDGGWYYISNKKAQKMKIFLDGIK